MKLIHILTIGFLCAGSFAITAQADETDYVIDYPDYVTSNADKVEFSVSCVVVYEGSLDRASSKESETMAKSRIEIWETELESLIEKKKKRKKLLKTERKAFSPDNFGSLIEQMKILAQCENPSEDMRGIG